MANPVERKYHLSREMYRNIKKKMDAEQIGDLLSQVYMQGYHDATKNTGSIGIEDLILALHEKISEVKGIGEKRLLEIDDKIREFFQEGEE